jgi:hypothetical protein
MVGRPSCGGSLALRRVVDEHGDALVYDFRAELGLHLPDVLDEGWDPRYVLTLIGGLPDTSCYVASVRAGDDPDGWRKYRGWGQDRMLAADQWDLTAAAAMAGAKHKRAPRYPRPVKRGRKRTWRDLMSIIAEAEVSPDG